MCRGRRRRDRPAARRRHGPRQGDRPDETDDAGRHRDPVPVANQPPRIRARARRAWRPDLRLQGARLLRRRRDQGRHRAAALPRGADVAAANRGVPAVAVHPRVRSRPRDAGAAILRRCCWRTSAPAAMSALDEEDAAVLRHARRTSGSGWRRPTVCLRPNCSIRFWPTPRMRSSSAATGAARRGKTSRRFAALVRRIQNRGYATLPRLAETSDVADRGRRIERRHRGARLGQPDDRPRVEGTGISCRLRGQPRKRRKRSTTTGEGGGRSRRSRSARRARCRARRLGFSGPVHLGHGRGGA